MPCASWGSAQEAPDGFQTNRHVSAQLMKARCTSTLHRRQMLAWCHNTAIAWRLFSLALENIPEDLFFCILFRWNKNGELELSTHVALMNLCALMEGPKQKVSLMDLCVHVVDKENTCWVVTCELPITAWNWSRKVTMAEEKCCN